MKQKLWFVVTLAIWVTSHTVLAGPEEKLKMTLEPGRQIRVSEVEEYGHPALIIEDTAGPNEHSQIAEWASRRIAEDQWVQGPDHSIDIAEFSKPDPKTYDPAKRAWGIHSSFHQRAHFQRYQKWATAHVEIASELPYNYPLTLRIQSINMDGLEHLGSLRDETFALALPFIREFIQTHQTAIEESRENYTSKIRPLIERNTRQNLQLKNFYKFIRPNSLDEDEIRALDKYRLEILEGKYIPPIPLVPYFEAPLENALIVVHANWKEQNHEAMNELVSEFYKLHLPIAYLMDGNRPIRVRRRFAPPEYWPLKHRNPTVGLYSFSGEHCIRTPSKDVTVAGNNWGECHQFALIDAIIGHFSLTKEPLTIHLPGESIAGGPLLEQEPQFDNLEEFFTKKDKIEVYENAIIKSLFSREGMKADHPLSNLFPPVLFKDYTFKFYLNKEELPSQGVGTKLVQFKIWNQNRFIREVLPTFKKPARMEYPIRSEHNPTRPRFRPFLPVYRQTIGQKKSFSSNRLTPRLIPRL